MKIFCTSCFLVFIRDKDCHIFVLYWTVSASTKTQFLCNAIQHNYKVSYHLSWQHLPPSLPICLCRLIYLFWFCASQIYQNLYIFFSKELHCSHFSQRINFMQSFLQLILTHDYSDIHSSDGFLE